MNSFNARSTLRVGGREYQIYRIDALERQGTSTEHLPFALRILLENLLRMEDGRSVTANDVVALAGWSRHARADREIPSPPAGFSCRISPEFPRSWTWQLCGMP